MPTFDDEEKELLESKGIPLTNPDAKADVDETAAAPADPTPPAEPETPADDDETPAEPVAEAEAPAADDGGLPGGEAGTAAGSGGPGGDQPVPADPTPAAPVVPKPEAVAPPPSKAAQRLAEVEAAILADDYDPYSAEGKKLQLEHNRLAAKVEAEPLYAERREAAAWAPIERQFPGIPRETMHKVLAKQYEAYAKDGLEGDALTAAATVAMKYELQAIANGKQGAAAAKAVAAGGRPAGAKVAPPVAKTPITPKGAIVAPPKSTPVAAAPPRERTDEEELVEHQRKHFPAGMRRALRG